MLIYFTFIFIFPPVASKTEEGDHYDDKDDSHQRNYHKEPPLLVEWLFIYICKITRVK